VKRNSRTIFLCRALFYESGENTESNKVNKKIAQRETTVKRKGIFPLISMRKYDLKGVCLWAYQSYQCYSC